MMKLFEHLIINLITTFISFGIIFLLIKYFYGDDISNISNLYEIYNSFIKDYNISDYNISFGEITIDKPSFNFSANKVSIDGFDIILNNNK